MKIKQNLFLILGISILSSCFVTSLHPLYTEADLVYDENLLGNWMDGDSVTWKIEQFAVNPDDLEQIALDSNYRNSVDTTAKNYYRFIYCKPADTAYFSVRLIKLSKYIFFDFSPDEIILEKNVGNSILGIHLLPVHSFAKAYPLRNDVFIHWFDAGWMDVQINEKKTKIKHEKLDGRIVLTASTDELQKFFTKHADNQDAFTEHTGLHLKRLK